MIGTSVGASPGIFTSSIASPNLAFTPATWKVQVAGVKAKFGEAIEEVKMPGEAPTEVPIIYVRKESVIEVLRHLKSDCEYNFLSDLTATDEEIEPRFEVVYNLFSHTNKCRIRVKTRARDGEDVPTATSL